MDCRILVRFIGVQEDLDALWSEFMEHFPEAELPSVDSGEWYSVEDYMTDEYECRFEELPESELYAVEGWGEFNADRADDGSDEANEISEAVLGF